MSIQSEIDRIKTNVSAVYDAVEEMGGTLPEEQNSDNLAGAVMSIPKGGGTGGGVPVGTVISYLGTTPPTGYLLCNGTIYNISDYPELAAFIEREYESKDHFGGDGTETFAVPDLQGRFLLGRSESHEMGETGGSEEVTLTVNQMPEHNHSYSVKSSTSINKGTSTTTIPVSGTASSGYSTGKAGSSEPHPNMPPYFTVSLLIKAE